VTDFFGLPAHPLFAHIPVVLIPLCALGAVLMCWQKMRDRIGWIVLGLLVIAGIATQLTITAGQSLKEYVKETQLMRDHVHMGENVRPWLLLMFLCLLGVMLVDREIKKRAAAGGSSDSGADDGAGGRDGLKIASTVLLALSIVFSALSVYWIYEIGHSGSKAVWQPTQTKIDKGQGEPRRESNNEGPNG
jgi:hypothetical protein